jgi:ATP-dependent helicase/nuclease subunit B
MAVRLVIGRAGSGKTRRCFKGVVAALRADPLGPPVYWIVPKQATFMTERQLTCASGLGGFCRARVLSLDSLGEEIQAECGGAAVPEVTALGRQMILGHLLRKHQPQLRFFGQAARQSGLATKLDATIAEFERNGRDLADLGALVDDLGTIVARTGEQQTLYDKVHDLRLIYQAYTEYVGQDRLDRHQRLSQVLSCMATSRRFAGATVYVDGFASFTEYERRVLAQLGKVCASVEIMLLMDTRSPLLANPHLQPNELGWFHSMEETYRRLWFTFVEERVSVEETVILPRVHRFAAPALASVEDQLQWRFSIARDEPAGIEMIEATDRRAEVDAVARRIRALWRDGGVRLREIAVLCRDLEPYHELISASFREHEIEYFVDRRRQVGHHPLLQFLRACLAIAQGAWPHDAVMTVVKSGLSGLTDEQADELENYVLRHRVRGSAWSQDAPWAYARQMLAAEDETSGAGSAASDIDGLRRALVGRLAPFIKKVSAKALTLREIVLRVFELFETFNVSKRLAEWMEASHDQRRFEQRDEHAQVWTHLVDLLDQMVALMGDEPGTLADFIEIYEAGLEQFELSITPPTTDEVLVGQVDRTRCPDLRVVFVIGLNEGVFPKMPGEASVLSDAERREFRSRSIEIDPDTQRRLLDENLLGYIALTRASERLIVTRSLTDAGGKSLGPSQYWSRLRTLFPNLTPMAVGEATGVDTIGTPRQMIVALMRWVRTPADEASSAASSMAALYQWLATHPPAGDAIDTMRYRAWKALAYANQAQLSKAIARRLFVAPLHASVTRIEAFAACPFKHFARYGLELRPREDDDAVSAIDLGNVFHHVLERIVATMLGENKKWQDLPAARRKTLIHSVAQDVGQQLRGEIMLSTARNRYLLERIEQTLEEVTAAQEAAARRGEFAPAFAELTFGDGVDAALPGLQIVTPAKRKVVLQGKIDRVDVVADQAAFAVIDYKLHGNSLSLDRVYHGLSLQLLTYLLVLRENGEKLTGRKMTPAAAFYIKLLRQLEDVKHPDDANCEDPSMRDLRVKPRGIFGGGYLKSLDGNCVEGHSDVVNAYLKKDGSHGNRRSSDVADSAELLALIDHVRRRIGELADLILDGRIELLPFQIRSASPCPNCDFQPLCRFDPAINRYKHLDPMGREDVLKRVVEEGAK